MALDLATTMIRTRVLIQDQAPTLEADPDIEEAIRQALSQYSIDVPLTAVADLTGDGSSYDFDLPTGYVAGQSRVITVEYPAGEQAPLYIDPARLTLYETPLTTKLRFTDITPGSGDVARLVFTKPHTLEDLDGATSTTIPARHEQAFVTLAAAQGMFLLAARFLHEQENTLGADTVDRQSKSEEASRLGRALLSSYRTLAQVTARGPAAMTRIQWGSAFAPGVGRVTHGRWRA